MKGVWSPLSEAPLCGYPLFALAWEEEAGAFVI